MTFRSNMINERLLSDIEEYFTKNLKGEADREKSLSALRKLYKRLGPPIEGYPTWHPFIRNQSSLSGEDTKPSKYNGYNGLDHTRCFLNGFITCPYGNVETVLESVEEINEKSWVGWSPSLKDENLPEVRLVTEKLNFKLYNESATPIMVLCDWGEEHLEDDGTLKTQTVFSLFLEHESPSWRFAELAEPWETMRPYLLGEPSGGRSSYFVNQKTGQAIKTVYKTIIQSGASGGLGKLKYKRK